MGKFLLALAVITLAGATLRAEEPAAGDYYVQGDVNSPGRLRNAGEAKVLDALKQAGGLMPSADRAGIRLVRAGSGTGPARILPIDYDGLVTGKDLTTNYRMQAGDRIFVIRRTR